MNSEIYQEMILDRYKNPINSGSVSNADASSKDYNPSCGDAIEIQMKVSDGVVENIKFQGQGCAISQSSVDILLDMVKSKNLDEVKNITPEDFLKRLDIELSPLRMRCALLGLKVFKTTIYTYLGNETK